MRDFVFLFGAGASFGAGGILPERPPLGADLFPILQHLFPASWGGLPIDIAEEFRSRNFEAGMKLVYERHGMAIPQLMRDMAIYFIQFRPFQRRTLYCRLVDDLARMNLLSRTIFSTLNYECVLEFSIAGAGIPISYFDAGNVNACPVWKLHGSSNFFSNQVNVSHDVFYSTGVVFEGGVQAILDSNRVIGHCLVETGLAPAMCLYMEGKPLSISPSVIRQLQEMWKDAVSMAQAIFCIGVYPLEADDHIWSPIAETEATLFFVGNKAAFSSWAERNRHGSFFYLGARFHEAYQSLIERISEK
ncbi:MAG: hypothetical protein ACYDIC_12125 [Desulfobaccales bacterium]